LLRAKAVLHPWVIVKHLLPTLTLLLVPASAFADGVYGRETETRREVEVRARSCGGDAFSFAEVTEGALAHRGGPVVSVPDTLCADLESGRPSNVGSVAIQPSIGGFRESRPHMRMD
jgi:hypothetical protein